MATAIREHLRPKEHCTTVGVYRRMEEVFFGWPMNIRDVCRAALKLLKREKRIRGGFRGPGSWCVTVSA